MPTAQGAKPLRRSDTAIVPPAETRLAFRRVGLALQLLGLNHTHSGNLSALDPADPSRFWITASGAPLGNLGPSELVRVCLSDFAVEGGGRPSSEVATHRAVLRLPGAAACAHAHALYGGLLGYESAGKPRLSAPRRKGTEVAPGRWFTPPDLWGRLLLGPVPIVSFRQAFGSPEEMVQGIATALSGSPLVLVARHGPFCRGRSLAECLQRLCVFEQSARIAALLARTGAGSKSLPSLTSSQVFLEAGERIPRPAVRQAGGRRAAWSEALFTLGLSACGTGSMSVRLSSREIAWVPAAAAPRGWEIPQIRRPLDEEPFGLEGALHRLVHTRTPYRACILAAAPYAIAAAAATPDPEILPVDDEARHTGIRLKIVPAAAFLPDPEPSDLPRLLEAGGGCLILEGVGILGCGRKGLGEAALRVSLAERVCRLRHEIALNHRLFGSPPPVRFEKPFCGRRP